VPVFVSGGQRVIPAGFHRYVGWLKVEIVDHIKDQSNNLLAACTRPTLSRNLSSGGVSGSSGWLIRLGDLARMAVGGTDAGA
jgi:hypothetical protein